MHWPAKKLSICFVSATSQNDRPILDPSTRYRCYHSAEALTEKGHICAVVSLKNFLSNPSYDYDVYVFHRPAVAAGGVARVLRQLRQGGKVLIADYDDLIFGDERLAMDSSAAKNGTLTADQAIKAFATNLEALRLFDRVSASTGPLREKVMKFNPDSRVEIVPNALPDSIFAMADKFQYASTPRPNRQIGYFCGTRSHNCDFLVIYDVINRVLWEDEDVRFLIVGPLTVDGPLAAHPRVQFESHVGYWRLPSVMARCRVSVSPLEMGEFNKCKSRVKFLEAALTGCHLIATPVDDIREVADAWVSLAESEDDWYEALAGTLSDEEYRARSKENLEYLRRRCHSDLSAHNILDLAG